MKVKYNIVIWMDRSRMNEWTNAWTIVAWQRHWQLPLLHYFTTAGYWYRMTSSTIVLLFMLFLISSLYISTTLSFQPCRSGYNQITKRTSRASRSTCTQLNMVMPSSSKFYASDSRRKEADALINNQIKVSPVRVIDGCAMNDAGEIVDEKPRQKIDTRRPKSYPQWED